VAGAISIAAHGLHEPNSPTTWRATFLKPGTGPRRRHPRQHIGRGSTDPILRRPPCRPLSFSSSGRATLRFTRLALGGYRSRGIIPQNPPGAPGHRRHGWMEGPGPVLADRIISLPATRRKVMVTAPSGGVARHCAGNPKTPNDCGRRLSTKAALLHNIGTRILRSPRPNGT